MMVSGSLRRRCRWGCLWAEAEWKGDYVHYWESEYIDELWLGP